MLLGVRWGSLQTKIIAWTLVPMAILLVTVSLLAGATYRHVTNGWLLERGQVVVVAYAHALAAEFTGQPGGSDRNGAEEAQAAADLAAASDSYASDLAESVRALGIEQHVRVYVVDGAGTAVYHPDAALRGADMTSHLPVGGLSSMDPGSGFAPGSSNDLIVSFARVKGTPWILVTEEPRPAGLVPSRGYGAALIALLLMGLAVPVTAVALGARRMTLPLRELILAAQEVAKGNFGRTIRAETGDEIEELAHEFTTMSKELEASYRHLEQRVSDRTQRLAARTEAERRRAEQFRVIAEVGRRMTAILPVDRLLNEIARLVQGTFDYYHVGIALVDGDLATYRAGAGRVWDLARAGDDGSGFGFSPASLRVGQEGVTGWVAGSGEALLVPDVTQEPRYVQMSGSETRSELAVPIIVKGQVIGVIDVQSDTLDAFDESDLTVMQSLANQAGIAIENARLYEQARQLAVLEERQRVARDLHDSVTQSLYGVTLYADAAGRLLGAGDIAQAAAHVLQLKATSKAALQEMRLLIFELRPPELEKIGLVAAIQARLDAVEGRAGLTTTLHADGVGRAPARVEDALYRIAQEALNNALKHASATSVEVAMRQNASSLLLEIRDDGSGFDVVAAREQGGIGLSSMGERALRLGGRLDIVSAPESGTQILVEVPL